MKRIKLILTTILTFIIGSQIVFAAGTASLTTNASSIENGSSVTATLTLRNTAAWNVSINSSGATSGCTQKFVGDSGTGKNTTKTLSVVCRGNRIGTINFSISGDITSEDGANVKISGSRSVNVVQPRAKSTNNKLSSISIEGFELTPEFDADVKEYHVTVPSTTEEITIDAKKADNYATLEGTGKKELTEGINVFEVIVTSETGVSNIYKVNVTVEDLNPIEVKINNKTYTVVKESKNLEKPDLFEETIIEINEMEIPAFVNDTSDYTLVGLKDDGGVISLYIYDDGKYQLYNEFTSSRLNIVFLEPDKTFKYFEKSNIKINGNEFNGYKLNDIMVLKGKNIATGEDNYYRYDRDEDTLQIFDFEEYISFLDKNQENDMIIYILSAALVLSIIITILIYRNNKKA